jgi:hypothetical protein
MLGYSSEELQQLSFLDICVDEDRDKHRVSLRELRKISRVVHEFATPKRAGDPPRLSSIPWGSVVAVGAGRNVAALLSSPPIVKPFEQRELHGNVTICPELKIRR